MGDGRRSRSPPWPTRGSSTRSPRAAGEHFDPADFLRRNGTVYLLGTSTGAAATAGLVGAFVEDVARGRPPASPPAPPPSRLDPPLSLILDEAANYPLPSLASLMSDGGGSGISTTVVLQSLAQARAVWGEHAASAIWDAAIVKVILGGGSNARDLDDLSKLHRHPAPSASPASSRGADGRRSTSTSTHRGPDPGAGPAADPAVRHRDPAAALRPPDRADHAALARPARRQDPAQPTGPRLEEAIRVASTHQP